MTRIVYDYSKKKRASTLMALALSECEAAQTLLEKAHWREAVVHLYYASFYVSQAFLLDVLRARPKHEAVESELHRKFGRSRSFPHRYVGLHTRLHHLRTDFQYKETHVPSPALVQRESRLLQAYVNYGLKHVPRVEIAEILAGIAAEHGAEIRDLSYDVYAPGTYSHHVRLTLWQPPFYLPIFAPHQIAARARTLLKSLRVKNSQNYVVGLNSRLDQYAGRHLLLLDIDSLDPTVESALRNLGGLLLKSGRGFHFVGRRILKSQEEWERELKRLSRGKALGSYLDKVFVEMSLKRGYATLRITDSVVKPRAPFFYKEL